MQDVMDDIRRKGPKLKKEVRRKRIGAKLRDMNIGAAPGPSGATNGFLKTLQQWMLKVTI